MWSSSFEWRPCHDIGVAPNSAVLCFNLASDFHMVYYLWFYRPQVRAAKKAEAGKKQQNETWFEIRVTIVPFPQENALVTLMTKDTSYKRKQNHN